jgi:hypothetical protein
MLLRVALQNDVEFVVNIGDGVCAGLYGTKDGRKAHGRKMRSGIEYD